MLILVLGKKKDEGNINVIKDDGIANIESASIDVPDNV